MPERRGISEEALDVSIHVCSDSMREGAGNTPSARHSRRPFSNLFSSEFFPAITPRYLLLSKTVLTLPRVWSKKRLGHAAAILRTLPPLPRPGFKISDGGELHHTRWEAAEGCHGARPVPPPGRGGCEPSGAGRPGGCHGAGGVAAAGAASPTASLHVHQGEGGFSFYGSEISFHLPPSCDAQEPVISPAQEISVPSTAVARDMVR